MKLLSRIPAWLRNKYFIATAVFAATLLFFDKNDFFTQRSRTQELRMLEKSKAHYQSEIAKEQKELNLLKNDTTTVERYAREKYLMKKDNEDVYVVPEKDKE